MTTSHVRDLIHGVSRVFDLFPEPMVLRVLPGQAPAPRRQS